MKSCHSINRPMMNYGRKKEGFHLGCERPHHHHLETKTWVEENSHQLIIFSLIAQSCQWILSVNIQAWPLECCIVHELLANGNLDRSGHFSTFGKDWPVFLWTLWCQCHFLLLWEGRESQNWPWCPMYTIIKCESLKKAFWVFNHPFLEVEKVMSRKIVLHPMEPGDSPRTRMEAPHCLVPLQSYSSKTLLVM